MKCGCRLCVRLSCTCRMFRLVLLFSATRKISMTTLRVTCFVVALLATSASAEAAPVLMISIDGLRPGDVLDADARDIHVPVLKKLAADGVYATGVRNALPT